MSVFDASSRSSTTDSRQGAGDASQQQHGQGNKLIQGGTDLTRANINSGNKVTGTDLSKAKLGKGASVVVNNGPSTDTLTDLFHSFASAFTLPTVTVPTTPGSPTNPSGTDITSIIRDALGAAGIGGGSSSSATPDAASSPAATSSFLDQAKAWWTGLGATTKALVIGGAVVGLAGLGYLLFKK